MSLALSDDELARALFLVDQRLDTLVDDEDSPLWDERQALLAEVDRRRLRSRHCYDKIGEHLGSSYV